MISDRVLTDRSREDFVRALDLPSVEPKLLEISVACKLVLTSFSTWLFSSQFMESTENQYHQNKCSCSLCNPLVKQKGRRSHQKYNVKKIVYKNFAKFSRKYLCKSHFIKKEALAHVLCCEFCKTFKNTCFMKHRTSDS